MIWPAVWPNTSSSSAPGIPTANSLWTSASVVRTTALGPCISNRVGPAPRRDFERVVALAERIEATDTQRAEAKTALLEAYLQLGRAHAFAHDIAGARPWFEKMHDLAENYNKRDPGNLQIHDLLASSVRKLADMKKLSRDNAGARVDYLASIALARSLVEAEPGNLTFKGHLAAGLDDLAEIETADQALDQARALYEEAIQLFREQTDADPDDVDARSRRLAAQIDLADLERRSHHYEAALNWFRRSLTEMNELKRSGRLTDFPDHISRRIEPLKQSLADCEAEAARNQGTTGPNAAGPLQDPRAMH